MHQDFLVFEKKSAVSVSIPTPFSMPLPDSLSTEEFASLVGLSGRRIRQLADEGYCQRRRATKTPRQALQGKSGQNRDEFNAVDAL